MSSSLNVLIAVFISLLVVTFTSRISVTAEDFNALEVGTDNGEQQEKPMMREGGFNNSGRAGLNDLLEKLWPRIRVAMKKLVSKMIPPLLPTMVTFRSFDLGPQAATLSGFKLWKDHMIARDSDNKVISRTRYIEVLMKLSFYWQKSKSADEMFATDKGALRTLEFEADVVVRLGPTLDELPVFSGISMYFVKVPKISKPEFTGAMALKGEAIVNALNNALSRRIVTPNAFVIPLASQEQGVERSYLLPLTPIGVLIVYDRKKADGDVLLKDTPTNQVYVVPDRYFKDYTRSKTSKADFYESFMCPAPTDECRCTQNTPYGRQPDLCLATIRVRSISISNHFVKDVSKWSIGNAIERLGNLQFKGASLNSQEYDGVGYLYLTLQVHMEACSAHCHMESMWRQTGKTVTADRYSIIDRSEDAWEEIPYSTYYMERIGEALCRYVRADDQVRSVDGEKLYWREFLAKFKGRLPEGFPIKIKKDESDTTVDFSLSVPMPILPEAAWVDELPVDPAEMEKAGSSRLRSLSNVSAPWFLLDDFNENDAKDWMQYPGSKDHLEYDPWSGKLFAVGGKGGPRRTKVRKAGKHARIVVKVLHEREKGKGHELLADAKIMVNALKALPGETLDANLKLNPTSKARGARVLADIHISTEPLLKTSEEDTSKLMRTHFSGLGNYSEQTVEPTAVTAMYDRDQDVVHDLDINDILKETWSSLGLPDAVMKKVRKDVLPDTATMFNEAQTAYGQRAVLNARLTDFRLSHQPPKFNTVVLDDRENYVQLNMALNYQSGEETRINGRLGLNFYVDKIWHGFHLGMKKIGLGGKMVIRITHLLEELPVIGGISIYFSDMPQVQFQSTTLSTMFANLVANSYIIGAINKKLADSVVIDNAIKIPVASGSALGSGRCIAVWKKKYGRIVGGDAKEKYWMERNGKPQKLEIADAKYNCEEIYGCEGITYQLPAGRREKDAETFGALDISYKFSSRIEEGDRWISYVYEKVCDGDLGAPTLIGVLKVRLHKVENLKYYYLTELAGYLKQKAQNLFGYEPKGSEVVVNLRVGNKEWTSTPLPLKRGQIKEEWLELSAPDESNHRRPAFVYFPVFDTSQVLYIDVINHGVIFSTSAGKQKVEINQVHVQKNPPGPPAEHLENLEAPWAPTGLLKGWGSREAQVYLSYRSLTPLDTPCTATSPACLVQVKFRTLTLDRRHAWRLGLETIDRVKSSKIKKHGYDSAISEVLGRDVDDETYIEIGTGDIITVGELKQMKRDADEILLELEKAFPITVGEDVYKKQVQAWDWKTAWRYNGIADIRNALWDQCRNESVAAFRQKNRRQPIFADIEADIHDRLNKAVIRPKEGATTTLEELETKIQKQRAFAKAMAFPIRIRKTKKSEGFAYVSIFGRCGSDGDKSTPVRSARVTYSGKGGKGREDRLEVPIHHTWYLTLHPNGKGPNAYAQCLLQVQGPNKEKLINNEKALHFRNYLDPVSGMTSAAEYPQNFIVLSDEKYMVDVSVEVVLTSLNDHSYD